MSSAMVLRTIFCKFKPTYLSLYYSVFKLTHTSIIQHVLNRPPCGIFIKLPIISIASYATRTRTTEKRGNIRFSTYYLYTPHILYTTTLSINWGFFRFQCHQSKDHISPQFSVCRRCITIL